MKDIFNNIDELILTKSYKDLSSDERIAISELASTESDFDQLKATMLAVQKQITNEKTIEARPETKAALMKEFKSARPAALGNTSKMGLGFFFSKGKPLAQMPGLQILTAAACLLMIITVFRNIDLNGTGKKVAYEEAVKTSTTNENSNRIEDIPNNEVEEKAISTEDKAAIPIEMESSTVNKVEIEQTLPPLQEADLLNSYEVIDAKRENEKVSTVDNSTKYIRNEIPEASVAKDYYFDEIAVTIAEEDMEDNEDMDLLNEMEEEVVMDKVIDARTTSSGSIPVLAEVNTEASAVGKELKKKINQADIQLSRTLEEDAELIDLFYTAM